MEAFIDKVVVLPEFGAAKLTAVRFFCQNIWKSMKNFVSLTSSKILSLENKNEKSPFFILYFARLFVSLQNHSKSFSSVSESLYFGGGWGTWGG